MIDLSRTTGDSAPRLAYYALKSLACGFGSLEGMTDAYVGGTDRLEQGACRGVRTCPQGPEGRLLCARG